jgi:MFS family permease
MVRESAWGLGALSSKVAHTRRDVNLLLLAMGLNSLPLGFTLVVLPIYLSDIGFSGEVIGAVSAVSAFANTIALIPFAIAADRYGRKPFTVWGLLSAALAYVFFAFTHDLNSLLLAAAIGGVGLAGGFSSAVWVPAWTALLAEKSTHEKRTKTFAWSQGIWTIALTGGSMMSILPLLFRTNFQVQFLASYQYAFLIFVVLSLISALVLLPMKEHREPSKNIRPETFFPKNSLRQIGKFSITFGLLGFGSGISYQLLALWFNRMYGINEAVLGPWIAAAEITSLVVVPIIPILTRNLGSAKSVLGAQGFSAVFLVAMIFSPTYQLAGAIFVIRNFLMNISWPVQQSYLMGTVTPDERASASAITSTIWGVGSSIGPLFAGYLLSANNFISISAPLVIGGAVYLVSAVGFYFFFRGLPPPEEAPLVFKKRLPVSFHSS